MEIEDMKLRKIKSRTGFLTYCRWIRKRGDKVKNEIVIDVSEIREQVKKQEAKRLELYGESSNRRYLSRHEVIEKVMKEIEKELWEKLR